MKGSAIQIDLIKDRRTGFPLTFVTDMGWFKKHHMKREVRVGRYWTDFANDIGRCIEVDGRQWHMDVVKEQQRDDYIKGFGYLLLHLKAGDIYDNPDVVRRRVITFLLHGK